MYVPPLVYVPLVYVPSLVYVPLVYVPPPAVFFQIVSCNHGIQHPRQWFTEHEYLLCAPRMYYI